MRERIFNPIFKDSCTFLKTSEETEGRYSEMEVVLGIKGENPPHLHTKFTETFTALEGQLGITLNGRDILLKPGEQISVPAGEVHRFFNPGNIEIKYNVMFTPGHPGMENMLRILYGLARDGKTRKNGIPKSLTTIALLFEMGNTQLPGFISWISPFLKRLAARARKRGLEQEMIETYGAKITRAQASPSIL